MTPPEQETMIAIKTIGIHNVEIITFLIINISRVLVLSEIRNSRLRTTPRTYPLVVFAISGGMTRNFSRGEGSKAIILTRVVPPTHLKKYFLLEELR